MLRSFLQSSYVLTRQLCSPLSLLCSSSSDAQQSCLWQIWGDTLCGVPPCLLWVQVVPHGTPCVDVGQELLIVSGRQRPAGAERAESTSPLLRGFSSQWGRGGCLPQPESPGNPAAQGLLAFSPAEQGRLAGVDVAGGTKTGGSGVRVGGVGCWGGGQWRRRPCAPASVRGKIGEGAAFEASSTASHNGEVLVRFCRA